MMLPVDVQVMWSGLTNLVISV